MSCFFDSRCTPYIYCTTDAYTDFRQSSTVMAEIVNFTPQICYKQRLAAWLSSYRFTESKRTIRFLALKSADVVSIVYFGRK